MLSLASYLDECSAKLKREALGHIQVGVAGAPPNHFHPFLVQNFGYSPSDDAASEVSDTAPSTEIGLVEKIYSQAQQAVSQVIKTSAAKLGPTGGGDAANKPQARAEYVSPTLSKATVFKPGVEKFWSHMGLAKEYMPNVKEGKYSCPLCPSYNPRSNLDTVVTHIRRDHLNVSIGCYYCDQSFFSSEGWKKHLGHDHKKEKRDFIPLEMVETSKDLDFPDNSEIAEVKKEEAIAIEWSIGLASATNLDIEPDFQEVLEVMDMDSEQQGS